MLQRVTSEKWRNSRKWPVPIHSFTAWQFICWHTSIILTLLCRPVSDHFIHVLYIVNVKIITLRSQFKNVVIGKKEHICWSTFPGSIWHIEKFVVYFWNLAAAVLLHGFDRDFTANRIRSYIFERKFERQFYTLGNPSFCQGQSIFCLYRTYRDFQLAGCYKQNLQYLPYPKA